MGRVSAKSDECVAFAIRASQIARDAVSYSEKAALGKIYVPPIENY
jgi:hypothetical protein